MRAADTNVLIRALVDDPEAPEQCRAARDWLSRQKKVYLAQVVQLELVWVLSRAFGFASTEIVEVVRRVADHPSIVLQAPEACQNGLAFLCGGGDFADGVLAHGASRVDAQVATFDRKLAKRCDAELIAPSTR